MIPIAEVIYLAGWFASLCMVVDIPRSLGDDIRHAGLLVMWPLVILARIVDVIANKLASREMDE